MKKAFSTLALVAVVIGLAACQKKDDSSSATNRAATPVVTTTVTTSINANEAQYKGELIDLSNSGDIKDAVVKLMAPNFGADYIGEIERVQVKIYVDAPNGVLNAANTTLFIKITDDYVNQTDQNGKTIEAIKLGFRATSGTVGANTYSIVFSDGSRQITVVATQGYNVQGNVKFKTNQMTVETLLGSFAY